MIKNKYKKILLAFVSKYIGYYYDGNYFEIELVNQDLLFKKAVKNFSPLIIIVSRAHYSEKSVSYPIDDKKEIKKLLQLESSSTKFHIFSGTESGTIVNKWFFQEKLSQLISHFCILIPESFILALSLNQEDVLIVNGDSKTFITRTNKGVASACQSAMISDAQHFKMSVGKSENGATIDINWQSLPKNIIKNLLKIPPELYWTFSCFSKQSPSKIFKKFLLPALSLFSMYLAVTSSYLLVKGNSITNQLETYKEKVTVALEIENQLETELKKNADYYMALTDFNLRPEMWGLFLELTKTVQFTNIRLVGERYVFRGETKKATEILAFLDANKNVTEAKFDYPVQKSRDLEFFVISFLIEQEQNNDL